MAVRVALGRSGLRVSPLGIGLWQLGSRLWGAASASVDLAARIVEEAWSHGVNLLDTAEIYGGGASERLLGEALRRTGLRDEFVVATKVAGFRTTRYTIVRAAEGSARRLGTTIDLLQYHWPPPFHARLCTVIRGLEDAVDRGLAAAIGVSNFPRTLLEKALECARRHEIASNQVQYSLAYRVPENELKPFMEARGVALIAWSPLAKGALAGAPPDGEARRRDPVYRRAIADRRLQEALERVASRHEVSRAVVALAWLIAKGAIPIPGLRRPERVAEYARALSLRLPEDDVRLLDQVSERYRGRGDYDSLQSLRLIPSPLQALAVKLVGGI